MTAILPSMFQVKRDNPRRAQVIELAIETIRELAAVDAEFQLSLTEVKRTLDQNAAMWPALTDIATQVDWPHTQSGKWVIGKMATASWKSVLTAAFEGETEMASGLEGGMVMVGARTSQYSRRKMGEFLTFVRAEGDTRGVKWSKKATDKFAEYINPAAKAA